MEKQEQEVVRTIIKFGTYICMNLKTAKTVFDVIGMDRMCEGSISICDAVESPVSFVVEIAGTKSYVYYNAKSAKVSYVCEDMETFKKAAADIETMKLRLDLKLAESMKDIADEMKKTMVQKIELNLPSSRK